MTEKESIERCKQIVKDNNEIIKEARKNGDINTMNLTASLDNDSIAIETVLKALEQKDKEIQELKEDNQHQWDERCKLTFELEKQEKEMEKLKADLYECNNIISDYIDVVKKKDKIIYSATKYIADEDRAGLFCDEEKNCINGDRDCPKCVLKYFEKETEV